MFKIKHCLAPLLGVVLLMGSVSEATNVEKSYANIEEELLKVVEIIGKTESKDSAVSNAIDINLDTQTKDWVGLSLKQPMVQPGTGSKPSKTAKQVQSSEISEGTYNKVMAISSKRSRQPRYRLCYQYNYQELQNKSRRYQSSITEASRRYGVSENLIKSVITTESCFKIKARSHRVARGGLMQLMPATARRFGVRNSYNSHQNIGAGTKYLRWLRDRFSGNVRFALAGYNAGEGKVDRYDGVPLYKDTQEYVLRVMEVFKTLHEKMPTSANSTYKPSGKTRAHYQKLWHQQQ